jgi:hypothetical protein
LANHGGDGADHRSGILDVAEAILRMKGLADQRGIASASSARAPKASSSAAGKASRQLLTPFTGLAEHRGRLLSAVANSKNLGYLAADTGPAELSSRHSNLSPAGVRCPPAG